MRRCDDTQINAQNSKINRVVERSRGYLRFRTATRGLEIFYFEERPMVSSKQVGTAAAAEQLGSMSLGGRDNDTEPTATAKNGTPAKLLCSACGEKSDTLKKCTACLCVWYCGKDCQNRHWKEHKNECKPIKKALAKRGGKLDLGTELDVGPLEKLPRGEECPICMRVLPISLGLQAYFTCCGKFICGGCDFQHKIKSREMNARKDAERARRKQPPLPFTCAFCREPLSSTNEEALARYRKRIELKDPQALCNMATHYGHGQLGLPVDEAKCIDLLRQSAGLGYPPALTQLGILHDTGGMGLEQNTKEALKYYKKAAEGGQLLSRHNCGCTEDDNGDHVAAMRHFRLSASGGYRSSMDILIARYEDGLFRHAGLAATLRAFYLARVEMKSKDRDKFIEHLKSIGEYKEEND